MKKAFTSLTVAATAAALLAGCAAPAGNMTQGQHVGVSTGKAG